MQSSLKNLIFVSTFITLTCTKIFANAPADIFTPEDVFELEWASDPQISPDGSTIVYVRKSMDIMTDKALSNLWIINSDGSRHLPITNDKHANYSPRWSPDGKKVFFITTDRLNFLFSAEM